MRVLVLNGPNLNLLGTREPEVYGTTTLSDLEAKISRWAEQLDVVVTFQQFNQEGDVVTAIQEASGLDGIVINPGALTHTSRSIGDAIRSVGVPAVVKAREPWRAVSLVSESAVRTIYGRGFSGYRDALRHLANRAATPYETIRYGPHPDNIADLRQVSNGAGGLVILVHGGFWLREWERDTMESLAVDLAGRGFTTLNVEYRRLGAGGGWPGSGHDVSTALNLVSHDPELSTMSTALIGHSAGGYLALWAAGRPRSRSVELTVGLAAVTDLELLADTDGAGSASALQLLDRGAPPQVDAAASRTVLVHGQDDDLVAVTHSARLGGNGDVELVAGLGHFEMLDPTREHWPPVIEALHSMIS
jgi:3-dehydroquinate dehydratase/predicted alpha/beta hydrolase family esterase